MHPDIYFSKSATATLHDKIAGAWLWSRRTGVVAGVAASALHGAENIDIHIPIELIAPKRRHTRGIIVRRETIADDELTCLGDLPVTTPVRTAFDLARHLPRGYALERLDALMRARPFAPAEVLILAHRHPGVRGLDQLRELIPLVDGGAESPRESRLRLLLIDARFPIPTTQIPVYLDGRLVAVLDMGWEEYKVAAEYDGDVHRLSRRSYVRDHYRARVLPQLGWLNNRVINEDHDAEVIARVHQALQSRGWSGQPVYPARSH